MEHPILKVEKHTPAWLAGLEAGDTLVAIDGAEILDEIDYQALSSPGEITLTARAKQGQTVAVPIRKAEGEPLGLRFGESLTLRPRVCHNHCQFCFIDQMPPGMRQSLYVKDDDWRYSLMMGNFVTLTNVSDAEFERMLARRASPLYISVHAHDPDVRARLMRNPHAAELWPRLERLKAEGLRFHAQIVCCPSLNDGDVLLDTVRALRALAPAARSVAVVPVGLTRFREGLAPLAPFTANTAAALLDALAPLQAEYQRELGNAFVFASDELYCLAGRPVPSEDWYAGYPQIENGVGLLRQLESELEGANAEASPAEPPAKPRRYLIPTGVSAAPHIARLCERFAPPGVSARVLAVENRYFGPSVTVTGLLTGGDVLAALTPQAVEGCDEILLCAVMLRHERDLFLDDMSLEAFRRAAPLPVRLVENDGQALYDALHARAN